MSDFLLFWGVYASSTPTESCPMSCVASVAPSLRPVVQTSAHAVIDASAAADVSVERASRARLAALRSSTRVHGRQVARNAVKSIRLPPTRPPVAARRRTIFGGD